MKDFITKVQQFFTKVFGLFRSDGLLHLETSALIVLACPHCIDYWSVLIAVLIGLLKEVYDLTVKKTPWKDSIHDLLCDAIGIIIGVLIGLYR